MRTPHKLTAFAITHTSCSSTAYLQGRQLTCKSDSMALRPIALHLLLTLLMPSSTEPDSRLMAWHHSCNRHNHLGYVLEVIHRCLPSQPPRWNE